jgi:hypothetical protein
LEHEEQLVPVSFGNYFGLEKVLSMLWLKHEEQRVPYMLTPEKELSMMCG